MLIFHSYEAKSHQHHPLAMAAMAWIPEMLELLFCAPSWVTSLRSLRAAGAGLSLS
jgi:hypothetical protein